MKDQESHCSGTLYEQKPKVKGCDLNVSAAVANLFPVKEGSFKRTQSLLFIAAIRAATPIASCASAFKSSESNMIMMASRMWLKAVKHGYDHRNLVFMTQKLGYCDAQLCCDEAIPERVFEIKFLMVSTLGGAKFL
jgi:hypothetical protein